MAFFTKLFNKKDAFESELKTAVYVLHDYSGVLLKEIKKWEPQPAIRDMEIQKTREECRKKLMLLYSWALTDLLDTYYKQAVLLMKRVRLLSLLDTAAVCSLLEKRAATEAWKKTFSEICDDRHRQLADPASAHLPEFTLVADLAARFAADKSLPLDLKTFVVPAKDVVVNHTAVVKLQRRIQKIDDKLTELDNQIGNLKPFLKPPAPEERRSQLQTLVRQEWLATGRASDSSKEVSDFVSMCAKTLTTLPDIHEMLRDVFHLRDGASASAALMLEPPVREYLTRRVDTVPKPKSKFAMHPCAQWLPLLLLVQGDELLKASTPSRKRLTSGPSLLGSALIESHYKGNRTLSRGDSGRGSAVVAAPPPPPPVPAVPAVAAATLPPRPSSMSVVGARGQSAWGMRGSSRMLGVRATSDGDTSTDTNNNNSAASAATPSATPASAPIPPPIAADVAGASRRPTSFQSVFEPIEPAAILLVFFAYGVVVPPEAATQMACLLVRKMYRSIAEVIPNSFLQAGARGAGGSASPSRRSKSGESPAFGSFMLPSSSSAGATLIADHLSTKFTSVSHELLDSVRHLHMALSKRAELSRDETARQRDFHRLIADQRTREGRLFQRWCQKTLAGHLEGEYAFDMARYLGFDPGPSFVEKNRIQLRICVPIAATSLTLPTSGSSAPLPTLGIPPSPIGSPTAYPLSPPQGHHTIPGGINSTTPAGGDSAGIDALRSPPGTVPPNAGDTSLLTAPAADNAAAAARNRRKSRAPAAQPAPAPTPAQPQNSVPMPRVVGAFLKHFTNQVCNEYDVESMDIGLKPGADKDEGNPAVVRVVRRFSDRMLYPRLHTLIFSGVDLINADGNVPDMGQYEEPDQSQAVAVPTPMEKAGNAGDGTRNQLASPISPPNPGSVPLGSLPVVVQGANAAVVLPDGTASLPKGSQVDMAGAVSGTTVPIMAPILESSGQQHNIWTEGIVVPLPVRVKGSAADVMHRRDRIWARRQPRVATLSATAFALSDMFQEQLDTDTLLIPFPPRPGGQTSSSSTEHGVQPHWRFDYEIYSISGKLLGCMDYCTHPAQMLEYLTAAVDATIAEASARGTAYKRRQLREKKARAAAAEAASAAEGSAPASPLVSAAPAPVDQEEEAVSAPMIAADDLVPLLTYVCSRAPWRRPHACLSFMANYGVSNSSSSGKEAYMLTVIQQCIHFICVMPLRDIEKPRVSTLERRPSTTSRASATAPSSPRSRRSHAGTLDGVDAHLVAEYHNTGDIAASILPPEEATTVVETDAAPFAATIATSPTTMRRASQQSSTTADLKTLTSPSIAGSMNGTPSKRSSYQVRGYASRGQRPSAPFSPQEATVPETDERNGAAEPAGTEAATAPVARVLHMEETVAGTAAVSTEHIAGVIAGSSEESPEEDAAEVGYKDENDEKLRTQAAKIAAEVLLKAEAAPAKNTRQSTHSGGQSRKGSMAVPTGVSSMELVSRAGHGGEGAAAPRAARGSLPRGSTVVSADAALQYAVTITLHAKDAESAEGATPAQPARESSGTLAAVAMATAAPESAAAGADQAAGEADYDATMGEFMPRDEEEEGSDEGETADYNQLADEAEMLDGAGKDQEELAKLRRLLEETDRFESALQMFM